MKSKIYTIYDKVAEECSPPFLAKNLAQASRMFRKSMENLEDSDCYALYFLSGIDTETMKLTMDWNPVDCTSDIANSGWDSVHDDKEVPRVSV